MEFFKEVKLLGMPKNGLVENAKRIYETGKKKSIDYPAGEQN